MNSMGTEDEVHLVGAVQKSDTVYLNVFSRRMRIF